MDKAVYSWGAGTHGQLGHGTKQDEFTPRAVASLNQRGICEASCGYQHTLFRSRSGSLLACGSNEFGQLLIGDGFTEALAVVEVSKANSFSFMMSSSTDTDCPSVGFPKHFQVRALAAGGQTSAVTLGTTSLPTARSRMQHYALLGHVAIHKLHTLIQASKHGNSGAADELKERSCRLFRSAAALTAVFSDETGGGVLYEEIENLYTEILPVLGEKGVPGFLEAISSLLSQMVQNLPSSCTHDPSSQQGAVSIGTMACAKAALIIAQSPLMNHQRLGHSLLGQLCKVLNMLDRTTTQQLVAWWSKCPPEIFLNRIVNPLSAFLSREIEQSQTISSHVVHCVIALDLAHRANLIAATPLGNVFLNNQISKSINLGQDYVRWREAMAILEAHPDSDPYRIHRSKFAFCSFAFLLNEEAKAHLLHVEANVMQQQEQMMNMGMGVLGLMQQSIPVSMVSSEQVLNLQMSKTSSSQQAKSADPSDTLPPPELSGLPSTHPAFCVLRLRRDHLLQDALDELCRQKKRDLFKPLKVAFIGEEGVDEGGLTKEFFSLITERVFNPSFGMFAVQEDTGVLWFNPGSLESSSEFMIVGLLLSLAVYNHVLVDVPFPRVLWKKLLDQPLNQNDVADLSPDMASSLSKLLSYDGPGSVEDVFCLAFEAGYNFVGEQRTLELKPGGASLAVTNSNRREYVQLYVDHILTSSIKAQFDAFRAGFLTMFHPTGLLRLLSPRELEVLVCGSPTLDLHALAKVAKYDGGYTASSQVIEWFWQVAHEMSEEDKKKLLKFVTGNDRSPIGGLEKLRFVIQRQGEDSMQLPTAHTCFNVLLLPEYTSRGKLRDRVTTAIQNAEGFGLK